MSNTDKFENCRDADAAKNTIRKFTNTIFTKEREKWLRFCPVPCQQKVYDVNVQKYHSNSMSSEKSNPKSVYLFLHYDSFVIEESVESLVYDIGSVFVAGIKYINHFTI